jgi:hypothetical protein
MNTPGFTADRAHSRSAHAANASSCRDMPSQLIVAQTFDIEPSVLPQQYECPRWLRYTATACPFFGAIGLWCRDYCGPPEGNHPIGGWYYCEICIGGR